MLARDSGAWAGEARHRWSARLDPPLDWGDTEWAQAEPSLVFTTSA